MSKSIARIEIERVEGMPRDHFSMQKCVFEGENALVDGDSWLRTISETVSKDSGYDKVDILLTLTSGDTYKAIFDLKHNSFEDSELDIRECITNRLYYAADPEKLPWLAADQKRLRIVKMRVSDEQRTTAARLLSILGWSR
jgi:hypothetical protein